mmetsp:Transcript_20073/g.60818  ORF Transcript_20073/g.60818 Transcript_20073/m.60818 type:complete len:306 (-) Transcript_20073:131-1048(-)
MGILRDELRRLEELHMVVRAVLDGVVHAAVPDDEGLERELGAARRLARGGGGGGAGLVRRHERGADGRDVVAAVALPRDEERPAHVLREEFVEAAQERDDVGAGVHGAQDLRAGAEAIADVAGLVQVEHVRVPVPRVRVGAQLARSEVLGLFDLVQRQRPVLRRRALHGGAARPAVGPQEQRLLLRLLRGLNEPVEEVVLARDVHVARPLVEVHRRAAGERGGELHPPFAHGIGAEVRRDQPPRVALLRLLVHLRRVQPRRGEPETRRERQEQRLAPLPPPPPRHRCHRRHHPRSRRRGAGLAVA